MPAFMRSPCHWRLLAFSGIIQHIVTYFDHFGISKKYFLTNCLMLSSHQRCFDGALKRRAKRHQSVIKLD